MERLGSVPMMLSSSSSTSRASSIIYPYIKKACARCHRLKMKCVFEDSETCDRCLKNGHVCSMTVDHSGRKRTRVVKKKISKRMETIQKLRNSIVSSGKELTNLQKDGLDGSDLTERNLDSLQYQLNELQNLVISVKGLFQTDVPLINSANSMMDGMLKTTSLVVPIPNNQNAVKVLISRGVLTSELARCKYDTFIEELNPCWPCVSFPGHFDFDWLYQNEPLMLLSLITATCLDEPDLHDILLCHLEDQLSLSVSGRQDISFIHIQIYLVLSVWCAPPKKWGSYNHQIPLMMSLNLTLCLDLGNDSNFREGQVLKDGSKERQIIRNFMSVYMSCGSLGLSVPRFKCVNWTPVHEKYCQLLLLGETNENDRFLYYSSKLISLGEEILTFICPNGFPSSNLRTDEVKGGIDALKNVMINFERRMQKLAMESGLFNYNSMLGNLLSIIYYQLLMTMYDYVVCNGLISEDVLTTDTYSQTLHRLIRASEKVIESFVHLSSHPNKFPTFFYYRPIHSLVSLIRVRLLVLTQNLDVEVNVEHAYERVSQALELIGENNLVAVKMAPILTRVNKWMNVSNTFNNSGANNSVVDLLNELGEEISAQNKASTTDNASPKKKEEQDPILKNIDSRGQSDEPMYIPSPIGYSAADDFAQSNDYGLQVNDEMISLQMINGLFNRIDFEIMGGSNLDDWHI